MLGQKHQVSGVGDVGVVTPGVSGQGWVMLR